MHDCEGMHTWGACMVGGVCVVVGGHAWLWGRYVVVGGMHGCRGGMHGWRGVHGWGGMCDCREG